MEPLIVPTSFKPGKETVGQLLEREEGMVLEAASLTDDALIRAK